jgi:rod shape-determining protein MreB
MSVGNEAKLMLGKTPGSIVAVRPMKDGVIADFEITEAMLRHFIQKVQKSRLMIKPRIVICVPYGITEVEKRAVKESAESAGAGKVFLIQEPMAAAIGAGLPVAEPRGSMIIDIGGGTTEVALISLSQIVYSQSIRIGGDKMDEAIVNAVKRKYGVLIGESTAERVKISIGEAYPDSEKRMMLVKGRDLVAGIPKTIEISSHEVSDAISDTIRAIIDAVRAALEQTPPELAADIFDQGLVLAGGGSLIRNLDLLLHKETGLPVRKADNPLRAVVNGGGAVLENEKMLQAITLH